MIGATLGPYRVLEKLGEGGMGVVYRARDTRLGRDVAIKVMPADLASEPDRLRRFEQEARTVAALSHPNIVALYDIGTHEGAPYLVSELLEGQTLREEIDAGGLPVRQAVDQAVQVARGLAAAHEKGIVHRDLKPENVFVTRGGHVKILDFGIAKLARPEGESDTTTVTRVASTQAGAVLGTMGYMAPEQVRGLAVDQRTDIFAFGCLLYEMLCGERAFKGATRADTMSAILKEDPPPLSDARSAVPVALQQIVDRCLAKRPEDRFSSAHDLGLALETTTAGSGVAQPAAATRRQTAPPAEPDRRPSLAARAVSSVRARPWLWLLGTIAVLAAVAAAVPVGIHQYRLAWVRNQALPTLVRLAEARDYWPAFTLASEIDAIVPDEPTVKSLRPRFIGLIKRKIEPKGATILARPRSGGDADWVELGKVTETGVPAPLGPCAVKVQAPGLEPREFSMTVTESGFFDTTRVLGTLELRPRADTPQGMVRIDPFPRNDLWLGFDANAQLAYSQAVGINSFFVDTHEVTNREYKRFVDEGGYRGREFWTEPFEREGKTLTWDEAMALLVDKTGRSGPANWEVGSFPQGTDDYPVTGVSWYEAAAYAAFANKRLPSVYHFAMASAWQVGGDFVSESNFGGKLARVGSNRGSLNYWSLYDTAGNAREWCANAAGRGRLALGGAADGQPYMFWNVDLASTRPPFERDPMTGFRCIRPVTAGSQDTALSAAIATKPSPDWASMKGFSDDAWKMYQNMLAYTKSPVDAKTEPIADGSPIWRVERATFKAAYGEERVIAYLYLPKNAKPPYQTVIYVQPGYGGLMSSSRDGNTQDASWWDYLVKDGRAVVYPIYKGIYERGDGKTVPTVNTFAEWAERAKDVFRTIDYLETRPDTFQVDKLGYLGISWGADVGTMLCAIERRFRAAVFQGAGLGGDGAMDREELGFAHACSTPVLMVNGQFDGYGRKPVFDALAAPPGQKISQEFPTDHSLAGYYNQLVKVNLDWFDKHLGPVR